MRWYSGNCLYFSNSHSHSAVSCGQPRPCGLQSTIERPDRVSRVMPPTMTMPKTQPEVPSSHQPTARVPASASGAAIAVATGVRATAASAATGAHPGVMVLRQRQPMRGACATRWATKRGAAHETVRSGAPRLLRRRRASIAALSARLLRRPRVDFLVDAHGDSPHGDPGFSLSEGRPCSLRWPFVRALAGAAFSCPFTLHLSPDAGHRQSN